MAAIGSGRDLASRRDGRGEYNGKRGGLEQLFQRFGAAVRQWALVEATFRSEYGLTAKDIFKMSWREFRILFQNVLKPEDEDDASESEKPFDINAAFDKAQGREPASSTIRMTLEDYRQRTGMA